MPFFFPFGLVEIGLVVVVVAALVLAGRRVAPDPTGRRPFAIYLLSVMFIMLFTIVGAAAQVGRTLADSVNEEPAIEPPVAPPVPGPVATLEPVEAIPPEPPGPRVAGFVSAPTDRTVSQVLEAGLVLLLAAGIFEFHRRQWRELLRRETGDG
jgi:hypothetical protein